MVKTPPIPAFSAIFFLSSAFCAFLKFRLLFLAQEKEEEPDVIHFRCQQKVQKKMVSLGKEKVRNMEFIVFRMVIAVAGGNKNWEKYK